MYAYGNILNKRHKFLKSFHLGKQAPIASHISYLCIYRIHPPLKDQDPEPLLLNRKFMIHTPRCISSIAFVVWKYVTIIEVFLIICEYLMPLSHWLFEFCIVSTCSKPWFIMPLQIKALALLMLCHVKFYRKGNQNLLRVNPNLWRRRGKRSQRHLVGRSRLKRRKSKIRLIYLVK